MFVLCAVTFTAPFWQAFHGISQREGIFGYKYMSSFLYGLGNPVFMVGAGLLIIYSKNFIKAEFSKVFKIIGYAALTIGVFFLIAVLFPKKIFMSAFGVQEYGKWVYYLGMFICAFVSGKIISQFQQGMIWTEARLKSSIKELVNLVVRIRKNEVDPNNSADFDTEMYKTLKKVRE